MGNGTLLLDWQAPGIDQSEGEGEGGAKHGSATS